MFEHSRLEICCLESSRLVDSCLEISREKKSLILKIHKDVKNKFLVPENFEKSLNLYEFSFIITGYIRSKHAHSAQRTNDKAQQRVTHLS